MPVLRKPVPASLLTVAGVWCVELWTVSDQGRNKNRCCRAQLMPDNMTVLI